MIGTVLTAVSGVVAILSGWLAIQWLWKRVMGMAAREDALSGRLGCSGCHCQSACEDAQSTGEHELHRG